MDWLEIGCWAVIFFLLGMMACKPIVLITRSLRRRARRRGRKIRLFYYEPSQNFPSGFYVELKIEEITDKGFRKIVDFFDKNPIVFEASTGQGVILRNPLSMLIAKSILNGQLD